MERISLSEVLKIMDNCRHLKSKETFSITFLKCDRKRRQGGDYRTIEKAQITGLPYSVRENEMYGIIDTESGIKSSFHIQLIFDFNGKRVYK
ncbi:hypothetical protein ACR79B_11210 [Sphingobacterium spiritivorum]|uniref:hypothetical protein n=1 Tax=Sphingobacterium spiritivorum TaxID=258 RepID=UPI003DA4B7D9